MPLLLATYASTSGHTEFVIERVAALLSKILPDLTVELLKAERAEKKDLERADILLLGSATWNLSGVEGQLNPHMHELLMNRAADAALQGKPVAVVSLGDDRYYYRTRCTEHLQRFIREHGGKPLLPPLVILNEPYDQGERIDRWTQKLSESVRSLKEWATLVGGK